MNWQIDSAHSEFQFKVRHMGISTVTGQFHEVDGFIKSNGDNWKDASASLEIAVDSINTRNEARDNHLKSDDFFNAEEFPHIKFESKSIEQVDDNNYKVKGEMTIRDYTHPVELDMEHMGTIDDPSGGKRAALNLKGQISRKEFGLKWNQLLAGGNAIVGDKINLDVTTEILAPEA